MQKARLIKRQVVHELHGSADQNRLFYQGIGFKQQVPDDKIITDPSVEVDYEALSRLNPENTRQADIENALLVWNSLHGMHPYLARDERFWAYLTHFHCRDYTWKRWFPPGTKGLAADASEDDKKLFAKSMRAHFFTRGSRGLVRGNAVSRLWWWTYIAKRYDGKVSLEKTLEVLLTYTDVRDAVVGRPATARDVNGFSAVMDVLIDRYDSDMEHVFFKRVGFKRSGQGPYQTWLKEINRHGGVQLLGAMPRKKLGDLFEELAVQAEQR